MVEAVATGVVSKTKNGAAAVSPKKKTEAVEPCAGTVLLIAAAALELNGGGGGVAAVRGLPSDVFVSGDTVVSFLKRFLKASASERSPAAGGSASVSSSIRTRLLLPLLFWNLCEETENSFSQQVRIKTRDNKKQKRLTRNRTSPWEDWYSLQ